MAATKRTKKQHQTKSKKTAVKKRMPLAKTAKSKRAVKREIPKKPLTKKKASQSQTALKTKARNRRATVVKTVSEAEKPVRRTGQALNTAAFPRERRDARSGKQSGDMQGLSTVEGADSESVDELLEEGNAFEADVVTGVEEAGNAEGREVHTHETPEDDVPEEYRNDE
jgi:hypothetical protein